MNYKNDITIAITSCWRYNLLKKNIESIEKTINLSDYKRILTEDSRNQEHIKKMEEANRSWFLKWWKILYTWWSNQKDVLKCHYYALKTLYENIDTKYVFHCEDDQVFEKTDFDYFKLSYDILENNNDIAIVSLQNHFKDYWIKKNWIMRSRYYDILTDNEKKFYGHEFIFWNPNCVFSLQPGLRRTDVMKSVMFWYEDFVNETLVSKRLSNAWYTSIFIKKWIYYNPNWRLNSTRNMKSIWFFKYIKITLKNAITYRVWLIIKYIKYICHK